MGHAEGHEGVLLDDQDGRSLRVDVADHLEDLLDQDRGKAHRRLVEEQQLRVGHQGAPDRQHLLLATGQRPAGLARPLAKPREEREDALEVPLELDLVGPRVGTHLEVLEDGHPAEDAPTLGRVAHAPPHEPVGRHVRDVVPVEGERPGPGVHEAAEGAEGRRLAGAVGAQQGDDLTLVDLQGDPLEGVDVAVVRMHLVGAQERLPPRAGRRRRCPGRGGHALAPLPR